MSLFTPSNIPSKVASRIEQFDLFGTIGELIGSAKSGCDHLQAELAGAIFPSMPGQPVGKYLDLSFGIDIHAATWPPFPFCPVPHVAMVFDIVAGIFGAISDNMDPPVPDADGNPPPFSLKTVVMMMRPSVKVNGQWIANAGTPLIHLPGIFLHVLPLVAPMAEAEMFMGSSKVLADGTPFSTRFHPALSCNTYGFPPPPEKPGKFKKPKNSLVLPTSMLLANFSHGKNEVLVGGPPTIDLFGNLMKLGMKFIMKGVGKVFNKLMDKLADKFDTINKIRQKLAKIQQKINCYMFGEPVDAATGRVFAENQDFYLPGPIPINWTRTYYSDAEINTPLGFNWHHSYHMGYTLLEDGYVLLRLKEGREVFLPPLIKGETFYHRKEKIFWKKEDSGYAFRDSAGLTYRFLDNNVIGGDFHPVTVIQNDYGNHIQLLYNYKGLYSIIDSCGRTLKVVSDEKGYIKGVRLEKPDGEYEVLVEYTHDEQGNLIQVTNDNGRARKRFYYEGHLLVRLTNQSGMNFYWEYEGRGDEARCIHTWGDEGILEYWIRYEEGKTITTNSLGHTTEYRYDEDFLIHMIIDAKGGITRQVYDANKELAVVISPEGNCTKYSYDEQGNRIKIWDANENTTSMKYDSFNRIINYRSAGGSVTKWQYDEQGRLVKRQYPNGASITYQYDEEGNISVLKDHKNRTTYLHWDEHHNLVEALLPDQKQRIWKYNFTGQLVQEILPNQSAIHYKYDEAGNLVELVEADGNRHYFTYNASGDIIKAKDNNQEVEFEYWGLGLLKSRTQNGKKIEFGYDTEEQLKSIKNEIGEAYRFTRDPLGQITGEWGFDGLQRQYLRNADGWVTRVLRPENRNTQYQYDGIGNIISTEYSDGSRECFTYNPDGQLIEAANETTTVVWERDKAGRIIKEIQNGYEVQSTYNADGNRTQITSSLGADIRNSFDTLGMLSQINTAEGWQATIERDSLGLETERTMTGGVVSQLERDSKGRVTRHQIQGKNLEGSKKRYIWGAGDRLLQILNEHNGQKTQFSYDTAGSLLSADYGGITKIYKMPDAIGNLFKTPERTDRKYAAGGKLLQDENWHYAYDKEGNLRLKSKRKVNKLKSIDTSQKQATSFSSPKGKFWIEDKPKEEKSNRSFWIDENQTEGEYNNEFDRKAEIRRYSQAELAEYDRKRKEQTLTPDKELEWLPGDWEYLWQGNGMLQAVRNPKGEWIRFEYDALGRRTAKIVGNTTIFRYIWEGNVLLHEWNYPLKDRPQLEVTPKGQLQYSREEPTEDITTWIYEEGSFTPSAKLRNGKKYSIVSDYLGTPYQAYNDQGELIWEVELDIYGKVKEDTFDNGMSIPFRYQGQYEDKETGLYYNRFRYYSPESGIYICQDPIGLGGGSRLYTYVKNSNYFIDPLGLNSTNLNNNLGGIVGDGMQAHHIIPEEIWKQNAQFFNDIGMGGDMDLATNGILLPDKASGVVSGGPQTVHRGSHPQYSAQVGGEVDRVRNAFDNDLIDAAQARSQISDLQNDYRQRLHDGDRVPTHIVDGKNKLH